MIYFFMFNYFFVCFFLLAASVLAKFEGKVLAKLLFTSLWHDSNWMKHVQYIPDTFFYQTIKTTRHVWRYSPKFFYYKINELIRKPIHCREFEICNIWKFDYMSFFWSLYIHLINLKIVISLTIIKTMA